MRELADGRSTARTIANEISYHTKLLSAIDTVLLRQREIRSSAVDLEHPAGRGGAFAHASKFARDCHAEEARRSPRQLRPSMLLADS